MAILLRMGSCPTQLPFHAAWEKTTAQDPPAPFSCYESCSQNTVHVQLFATCWEKLLQVFRLVYLCLGRVCVGFVAGALVCSGLFWPFGTLSLDLLGLLRPIGRTVGLGQGYCALGSVFHPCCWALLVDPLYFVCNSTSRHCCPSRHFVQGWTTLGDLP